MRYISISLLALLTIVFLSNCSNDKQVVKSFLHFEQKTIEDSYGACDDKGACGEISIEYPIFSENNERVDKLLNSEITKTISSFYDTKTIEGTSQKFIKDFTNFVTEFPESANNKWNTSMLYSVSTNTKDLLSLTFSMNGYTGGAHGFSTISYSNFNPNTGTKLKLEDIVSDVDKLRTIAREIFIKDHNLDPNKSLNEQGYWFVDDIFSLNNNFKLSKDEIIFHYNQYEIAPYSEGPIDITIPMHKLDGLLEIAIELY
jgi:hypothetical protein